MAELPRLNGVIRALEQGQTAIAAFTTAEIEAEACRQYRRADAENAKRVHYDLARYREFALKQAA